MAAMTQAEIRERNRREAANNAWIATASRDEIKAKLIKVPFTAREAYFAGLVMSEKCWKTDETRRLNDLYYSLLLEIAAENGEQYIVNQGPLFRKAKRSR